MKNNRSAPKRFLFCMKELRRRAGKVKLCLVWDRQLADWYVIPPSLVQVFGHEQTDIQHRNYEV